MRAAIVQGQEGVMPSRRHFTSDVAGSAVPCPGGRLDVVNCAEVGFAIHSLERQVTNSHSPAYRFFVCNFSAKRGEVTKNSTAG
jgi:hypothetical protein